MTAREYMRNYLEKYCLSVGGSTRLASGAVSSFYFDCKKATLNGEFLAALSETILTDIVPTINPPPIAVGGPTMGADFIAAAIVLRAHQLGHPLTHGSIARKEVKSHGTGRAIENPPEAPGPVLIVEDVITTGGSIATACDAFLAAGFSIAAIVAIIDREAGGKQALEEKYRTPVHALFNRKDFLT